MTVEYNFDVCSASRLSVFKLLLRWRGSIWKAVMHEMLFWIVLYGTLNIILLQALNDYHRDVFKMLQKALAANCSRIPLTFLLGFFVTVVFNRWSDIFKRMGFIDNIALAVSTAINGDDEDTRLLKRRIVRYAVLSQTFVFRDISLQVHNRFPNFESIYNAGIMTENEWSIIEASPSTYPKYWMPLQWAMRLIWEARLKGKICIDVIAWQLCEKFREFRTDLQLLCYYDWVPVPLSYPQIVIIGVRSYFLITIIARQPLQWSWMNFEPAITFLELLLLMGWVKVAENLLNPLGTDDDDFECNYVINRNFTLGYEIIDETYNKNSLPQDADVFHNVPNPMPLDECLQPKRKVDPYIGSVAAAEALSTEKQGEEGMLKKATTIRRRPGSLKSQKSPSFHRSGDSIHELSPQTLVSMHPKLNIVEEESSQVTDNTSIHSNFSDLRKND